MRWDILNYGRIINNVRVQDARFEELMVMYQQTVLAAGEDADSSLMQFIKSQEATEYLSQSVIATQRAFDLSLAQYWAGGTSFLNVLNASATLVEEQVQLVQSQAAVADGLISLERASAEDGRCGAARSLSTAKRPTACGSVITGETSSASDMTMTLI